MFQKNDSTEYLDLSSSAVLAPEQWSFLSNKLTEDEKLLINFEKLSRDYGLDSTSPCKYRTSALPRPSTSTALQAKPILQSNFSHDLTINPLITTDYKSFTRNSYSSKDLLALRKSYKIQSLYPTSPSKPVVRFQKKQKRKTHSLKKDSPYKPIFNSVSIIPSVRPNKVIRTPINLKGKIDKHDQECVWLCPRGVPFGPFATPFKGKTIKESGKFGVMFRPEASNSKIEKLASKMRKEFSSSQNKRIKSKFTL